MSYHGSRSEMSLQAEAIVLFGGAAAMFALGWLLNAVFSPSYNHAKAKYVWLLENEVGTEKAKTLLFMAEHDIVPNISIKKIVDTHDFYAKDGGPQRTIAVSPDKHWLEVKRSVGYGDFVEGPWRPISADCEWVKIGLLKSSEPEVEVTVGFGVKPEAVANGLIELD